MALIVNVLVLITDPCRPYNGHRVKHQLRLYRIKMNNGIGIATDVRDVVLQLNLKLGVYVKL